MIDFLRFVASFAFWTAVACFAVGLAVIALWTLWHVIQAMRERK